MTRMKVSLTLVLILAMAVAPLVVVAIPSPSGDFLSWCDFKYGPSMHGGANLVESLKVQPFGPELGTHLSRPFQQRFLDDEWLPWDSLSTGWSMNMHGMVQPLGVFHLDGHQHPPTLSDFQGSPSIYVKEALAKVAQLLQQPLLDVASHANIPLDGMIFQALFKWQRANGNEWLDICMPYNKAKVSRKRKRQENQVQFFSIHTGGYLRMMCGLGPDNKKIVEYAHRLVCFAFNGAPNPSSHKVVSHICNNPKCLNPRHLQWDTIVGNFAHPQGG